MQPRARSIGVIGGKPPHMMDEEERKKGVKIDDMFIDVGAINKEEVANLGIDVGTPITIDREFRELANSRVTGKAFDNRAGVAMLIKTLQTVKSPAHHLRGLHRPGRSRPERGTDECLHHRTGHCDCHGCNDSRRSSGH